jgi:hypothetical protein
MADTGEQKHNCEECPMRKRAEAKPKSLISRVWHWHTNWCPGWKSYQEYLAQQESSSS